MSKKALLVVAQNGYQPIEYANTRTELEEAGISVSVASPNGGTATASDGSSIETDLSIKDADIDNFDALVIIGGPGARESLSALPVNPAFASMPNLFATVNIRRWQGLRSIQRRR